MLATICHTIHFRLGIYAYIYGYELHEHLSNKVISIEAQLFVGGIIRVVHCTNQVAYRLLFN